MAETINSRTTLAQIQDYALNDFGVELTIAQAKEIKEAVEGGLVVWTPAHIKIVNGTFSVIPGHINEYS